MSDVPKIFMLSLERSGEGFSKLVISVVAV